MSGRSTLSKEQEPRVPEVVQSGELAIERERCGTADTVDSMDYAADALTKQYMKLRMSSGFSDGAPSRPASTRSTKSGRKKKTKPVKKDKPMPMLPPPRKKLYTPGPGAYSPKIDRYSENSLHSKSYSFGGGTLGQSDRSFLRHYLSQQSSPGPMYIPDKEPISTLRSVESVSFGRAGGNSRNTYNFGAATNSPVHNPGPGAYQVMQDKKGNKVPAGKATAAHSFGNSSFHQPQLNYSKTMFISDGHSRENLGVHSPGPKYHPNSDSSAKFSASPAYTTRPKGTMHWDKLLEPNNCYQPGPEYHPTVMRDGSRFLKESPKYTFKREYQRPAPSTNLSASAFITERHAKTANHSVHSPGPIYYPNKPERHKASPNFSMSGPKDRFYDRFEPNRIL
eukprot:jgi/Tetstr1/466591/TSEL_000999.t1